MSMLCCYVSTSCVCNRPFDNNNNNQDDVYCAVIFICGKAIARVHLGHLNEGRPVRGGRQLVGQAANLTFKSIGRLHYAKHSPITICITNFTVLQRLEDWVDPSTAVSVQPMPKAVYCSTWPLWKMHNCQQSAFDPGTCWFHSQTC